MNDIRQPKDEWQGLIEDWREQPAGRVDVEALLRGIQQRGRSLRWALASELAATALMLGTAVWATRSPGWNGSFALLLGVLVGAALMFQGWSLWARRRQLRDTGHGLVAMVELDMARARTTLRYWRISIWLSLAMLLAMLAMVVSAGVEARMWAGLLAIAPIGVGFTVWAWWRCRGIRARLDEMRHIRDELRME